MNSKLKYLQTTDAEKFPSFGMTMNERSFSGGNYRFGFNGKEKDNEINVDAGDYDFGSRIYDGRLGRWLSTDPVYSENPSQAPFNFAVNSPIKFIDLKGESPDVPIQINTPVIVTFTYKDILFTIEFVSETRVQITAKTKKGVTFTTEFTVPNDGVVSPFMPNSLYVNKPIEISNMIKTFKYTEGEVNNPADKLKGKDKKEITNVEVLNAFLKSKANSSGIKLEIKGSARELDMTQLKQADNTDFPTIDGDDRAQSQRKDAFLLERATTVNQLLFGSGNINPNVSVVAGTDTSSDKDRGAYIKFTGIKNKDFVYPQEANPDTVPHK